MEWKGGKGREEKIDEEKNRRGKGKGGGRRDR